MLTKRIGLWVAMLVMLTALFSLSALAETDPFLAANFTDAQEKDMTEADALALARKEWKDRVGVTDEDFQYGGYMATLLEMETGGGPARVWAVALRDREMKCPTYIVALDAQTGEILISRPYDYSNSMQEWENTLGARPLWSLEKEALFDRLYLRFQDDAGGFLLPVEGMILQEVATQTAYDALVVKGIPADTLDGLMVGVSLYRVQRGKDATQDTWNISYYHPVPDADGVFKEVGVATVDAYDGTLVNVIVMNPDSKG